MKKIDEYKTLLSAYLNESKKAICVSGIGGLGKSEIIKSVCQENRNYICINYNFAIFDSSFKEILASKIKFELLSRKYDLSYIFDNLNITETIFRMINCIDSSQKIILSFENIPYAKEIDIAFICELLKFSRLSSNFYIIIEEDTDCMKNYNYKEIKGCIIFKTLSISKYNKEEIRQYIYEQFSCLQLDILEKDMEHIYVASEGTFSITNVILNELEQLGLIIKNKNVVKIMPLPSDFLINGIEPYILKRFDNLNNDYKVILAKSSCIGFGFNCEDMFGIFSIAKVFNILKNIQDASHLITEIENEQFCFESQEAYNVINKKVEQYFNKIEILKNIAEYYKHSLTETLKKKSYAKYMTNLSLAKDLYETINDTPNILKCYQLLIGNKIETKLFSEALILCNEYEKLCVDKTSKYINNIQKLKCLIELEDYVSGGILANELQKKESSLQVYFKYYFALCQYGISEGKSALRILNDILSIIDKNKEALLYARTMRLLSSIYDFYDEWDYQIHYFTEAITICKDNNLEYEYYSMLRQSGMIYPYSIALSMYKSAEKFFSMKNDIKELAKVTHNIATDSMYMLDIVLAYEKCNQSIQHFKSIGNNNISNPFNLMGILLCLNEKKYNEALNYFNTCASLHNDKWTQCVGYLNASTAYRKIGDINNYLCLINKVKKINNGSMPIITVTLKLCELLYYFEQKQFNLCKILATEILSLEKNLEYRHKYIIKYILEKIGGNATLVKNNVELKTNYINSSCSDYLNKCLENNCYWATTRFWEN